MTIKTLHQTENSDLRMPEQHHAFIASEIRGQVEKLLKEASPHAFARIILDKIGISEEEFRSFVVSCHERFASAASRNTAVIPKISHRLWITDPANPHPPPSHYVEEIAIFYKENQDWNHFFWTNAGQLIAPLTEKFQHAGGSAEPRLLEDTFGGDPLLAVAQAFLLEKKFVMSADVVRFMVLKKFGGIYADLGVKCARQLLDMLPSSGAVINIDASLLFQLAFLAFPPEDEFVRFWAKICLEPGRFTAPLYPRGQSFSAIEELSFLSGPGFTAMVIMFLKPERPVLIVPQQGKYLQISSQKSWYGKESKFGNVIVSQTPPTRLLTAQHDFFRSYIDGILHERKHEIRHLFARILAY
jgi:hypothetical protein